MTIMKVMLCTLLLVACVALASGFPRGNNRGPPRQSTAAGQQQNRRKGGDGKHGKGHKLGKLACLVTNTTSGVIEKNRTCGCEGETLPCTWGPVTIGDREIMFCDVSSLVITEDKLEGVLRAACSVQTNNINVTRPCRGNATCNIDVPNVQIDGTAATVTLCEPRVNDGDSNDEDRPRHGRHGKDSSESESSEEDGSAEEDEACVRLTREEEDEQSPSLDRILARVQDRLQEAREKVAELLLAGEVRAESLMYMLDFIDDSIAFDTVNEGNLHNVAHWLDSILEMVEDVQTNEQPVGRPPRQSRRSRGRGGRQRGPRV